MPWHEPRIMKRIASLPALLAFASCLALATTTGCVSPSFETHARNLRDALTFHASFDDGTDADFALGDRRLFSAPSLNKRADARPGLPAEGTTVIARGRGRHGDALQFKKKVSPLAFFQAEKNLAYRATNWSGTVSFWLSVDPQNDLEPGFCDPIQITPRAWNDAAFFVEFEKKKDSIPFRLGAYADFKLWNPQNLKWDAIPMRDKPLLTVDQPPFGTRKWTHVAFAFEHFNTGRGHGVATLYLDGKSQGALAHREQTFSWEPSQTLVMLGLSYIGLFDELSLFNRALTPAEIETLHRLEGGVRSLLK